MVDKEDARSGFVELAVTKREAIALPMFGGDSALAALACQTGVFPGWLPLHHIS